MSRSTAEQFRTNAWALADAVQTDPSLVEAGVVELLECSDVEARVVARWALGRACYELGKLDLADKNLRTAMAASKRARRPDLEAQVRMSLAVVLIEQGFTAKGLGQLRAAEGLVDGSLLGRVLSQRSFVQCHLGRFEEAVGDADRSLVLLRKGNDHLGETRLLLNRALAQIGAGHLRAAESDLHTSRRIAERIGQQLIVAAVDHNLGAVRARQGRLPESLSFYAAAREQYQTVGMPARVMAVLEADTADAMTLCELHDDAAEAARRALSLAEASGNKVHEADAHLGLARAELAGGRWEDATVHAERAAELFRAGKRWVGYLTAQQASVDAAAAIAIATGADVTSVHEAAERLCVQLNDANMPVALAHTRALAGELAVRAGRVDVARDHWQEITRGRSSTNLMIRVAYLEALIARAEGEVGQATRALGRGLRLVAKYQASFGATEIQVQIGAHATRLAQMGSQFAMERGRAWEVLSWSERARGNALRIPPTAPPTDAHLSEILENVRHLHALQREALANDEVVPRLVGDLRKAERAVLDRARTIGGAHSAEGRVLQPKGLVAQLQESVLVSFIRYDARYAAVVVRDGSARLVDLAPVSAVDDEVGYLRSAIRRLFAATPTPRAGDAVSVAATRLDQLLLMPLRLPPDRLVIIVPTGALHGVAWGLLPGVGGSFVVSPSVACWQRAEQISLDDRSECSVAVVVGPRLPGAEREGAVIGSMYQRPRIVSGAAATVATTMQVLEQHHFVHLAAHGRFRADNPLFSSLELDDGPLMLFDLQSLDRVSAILILPSCSGGVSRVYAGDELIGTTAALLGLGAASIVAPICAVRDDITERLMIDLHTLMARGVSSADGLAACRRDWSDRSAVDRVTAGVFTSLGSDLAYQPPSELRTSTSALPSCDHR